MHSGTLGVSFGVVGAEGHKIGFSSNSVVPTQPIIIPNTNIAPKNNQNIEVPPLP